MALKYLHHVENEENIAKAYGRSLSISTKHSVEICNNIRGKSLEFAKKYLGEVVQKKSAVKMKRYYKDLAHKKGMGPGRYPVKAAGEILTLIESAESNAQALGLGTRDLVIVHISAHKAARSWRYGRKRRRKNKRTHIQVILAEMKKKASEEKKILDKRESEKKPAKEDIK